MKNKKSNNKFLKNIFRQAIASLIFLSIVFSIKLCNGKQTNDYIKAFKKALNYEMKYKDKLIDGKDKIIETLQSYGVSFK